MEECHTNGSKDEEDNLDDMMSSKAGELILPINLAARLFWQKGFEFFGNVDNDIEGDLAQEDYKDKAT